MPKQAITLPDQGSGGPDSVCGSHGSADEAATLVVNRRAALCASRRSNTSCESEAAVPATRPAVFLLRASGDAESLGLRDLAARRKRESALVAARRPRRLTGALIRGSTAPGRVR
jgi:hypothetical protein